MKRPSKQFLIVTGSVITLGIAGVAYSMYSVNKQASNTTVNPTQGSSSPAPSPGTAGNPGDVAKTAISKSASAATPAPTATPAAASTSSVSITNFTLTPQTTQPSSGQVYITSQITGITSGTCSLALTSPGAKSQTASGTVGFDGHIYFCSMSTITGVTEAGTWRGKLVATGPGNSSGSASTQFVVGE